MLDDSDVMGEQPYTLEVTSPGVDRPLTLPRHWRRNTGRLVAVDAGGGRDGHRPDHRRRRRQDGAATLDVEGTERRVDYAEVTSAKVQIEFNRRGGEEA